MIYLGPSGTSGQGYPKALEACKNTGLRCLEVEFTHGVRMQDKDARDVGELAAKNNVMLSVHGPYFINLVSKEKEKIVASKRRIIDSCQKASFFSTDKKRNVPVVFHAGYYQDLEKDSVYEDIKSEILEMNDVIKDQGWNVILAPEATGKKTQFGTVDELTRLSRDTGCAFCIDFAHILARNNGEIDYDDVLRKLPEKFHAHYSGINYSEKGEKNHVLVDMAAFKELSGYVEKYKKEITLIIESPDPMGDCRRIIPTLGMQQSSGGQQILKSEKIDKKR